jgi:hypothetical protein
VHLQPGTVFGVVVRVKPVVDDDVGKFLQPQQAVLESGFKVDTDASIFFSDPANGLYPV